MAEQNNAKTEKRGHWNFIIAGGVVLVAAALLIFVRPSTDERAEGMPTDMPPADTDANALHVAQQVVAGDYTYEFSGVNWMFDTESDEVKGTGQTWLKMEFADFTRNGNMIAFGRPYKLGAHPGTCAEADFIDTAELEGIPLGYAVCTGAGVKHEFAALQRLENVVVVMRETKGEAVGNWTEWYKIDVTEIVR